MNGVKVGIIFISLFIIIYGMVCIVSVRVHWKVWKTPFLSGAYCSSRMGDGAIGKTYSQLALDIAKYGMFLLYNKKILQG